MKSEAIIEIGSNSLKLLVAKTDGGKISPVLEKVVITRLSRGMKNSLIQDAPLQKTLRVLKEFLGVCAYPPSIFATAVLREAKNSKAVIAEIRRQTGLNVHVLSEREEAEFTCLGALSDVPCNKNMCCVVVDIGGKSTEIACHIPATTPDVFLSMPIGAVSLYERFIRHDPPLKDEIKTMRDYISDICRDAKCCVSARKNFSVIGVGGTFTTLASMKTHKIHHYKLSVKELLNSFDKLCAMTIRERIEKTGMEKGRADIIVAGAAIAIELLMSFGIKTVTISTRGVRYGLLSTKS